MLLRLGGEDESSEGGGGGGRTGAGGAGVKREGGRVRFRLAEISGRLVEPRHRGPGPVAESTKRCRDVKVTELRRSEAKRFFFLSASRSDGGKTRREEQQPHPRLLLRFILPPRQRPVGLRRWFTMRFQIMLPIGLICCRAAWRKLQIVPQG